MKNLPNLNQKKVHSLILSRLLFILAIIASLEIITGIAKIIQDISPYALGSYASLQNSFVNHFADHSFIIMGALALTIIIWGLTQKFWHDK